MGVRHNGNIQRPSHCSHFVGCVYMTRPSTLHVYATRVDRVITFNTPFHTWLSLLQLDQINDILQFIHQDDQERALVSRLLQIAVVSAHTGVSPSHVRIERKPGAKPRAISRKYIDYNVSHHGPWVFIACCTIPNVIVGVDVVSKKESAPIGYTPESWCRTEACLKALGLGLRGLGMELSNDWSERQIELDGDHVAVVVFRNIQFPIFYM